MHPLWIMDLKQATFYHKGEGQLLQMSESKGCLEVAQEGRL